MAATLPVFATVGTAYRLVWRHAGRLAGISWPLMAVYVIQQMIVLYMRRVDLVAGEQTVLAVFALFAFVLGISVTTSSYRLFVQGEGARVSLGFRREELLYLWALLRLFLLYFAIILALGIVVTVVALAFHSTGHDVSFRALEGSLKVALVAVAFVAILAIIYYLTQFVLILPAAALGQRMTLHEAARRAQGRAWRLWLAIILSVLPIALAQGAIYLAITMLLRGWPTLAVAPLLSLTTAVRTVLGIMLSSAVLSIVYMRLDRDAPAAAMPMSDLAPGPAD